MRDRITTALELAGFACISLGAFIVAPALGFAVAGAALLLLGILLGAAPGGSE